MICPHCGINFKIQDQEEHVSVPNMNKYLVQDGHKVRSYYCPSCNDIILHLSEGVCEYDRYSDAFEMISEHSETMIYPKTVSGDLNEEIPIGYRKDFIEASQVVHLSPKASAAISRRILQEVLHDVFNIKKRDLYHEIEEFINLSNIPTYLAESIDAVRNVGNFAAHPLKSTQTGQILDVEDGEAEWLLEVLEALFDFAFVQPIKLQERRNRLNAKLRELGKPEMLGKSI